MICHKWRDDLYTIEINGESEEFTQEELRNIITELKQILTMDDEEKGESC